jgi:hypothetical protein
VLQHLSNDDIRKVLPKLRQFGATYISEGQPTTIEGPINPDKPAGSRVRFDWRTGRGRGLELDKPPFGLPVREILRIGVGKESIVTVELANHE